MEVGIHINIENEIYKIQIFPAPLPFLHSSQLCANFHHPPIFKQDHGLIQNEKINNAIRLLQTRKLHIEITNK